jgi:hypothetical protein
MIITPGSTRETLTNPVLLDLTLKSQADRLPEFGILQEHVEIIAKDDPETERHLRRQLLGEAFSKGQHKKPLADEVREAVGRSGVRDLTYVQTILDCGHFLTVCPASGRPVKSDGSFAIDGHHIAYRFAGAMVFYLIVGRFHGRRSALCIPERNLLVTLNVPERGLAISRWVAESMRGLIAYSTAEPTKFASCISLGSDDLTLVIGGMPNFGHHVWQELAGIAELLSDRSFPKVRSLLVGPHTWFQLDKVFPELAGLPVVKCMNAREMLAGGFNGAGTLVRPVGTMIDEELRRRLRNAAGEVLGPDLVSKVLDLGAQSRLVWINLRAHNKKWNNQVEGYAGLLNALHDEFGNIGVVYDGWADTAGIRDDIDRRLHTGIVRHDTVGASIETSLLWAGAVTAYVSVVGSGLVINSWLTLKPGVAHANRSHLNQRSFWNRVSDGMIPATFINNQDVTDDGTLYGNYDLEWKVILDQIRKEFVAKLHQLV